MKVLISCLAGMTIVGLSGCGQVTSQEPLTLSAAGTNVTEVVHVDAAGAAALLREGDVVVLDVRTPREFNRGRIEGAVNIDFNAGDFRSRVAALDREKRYLVHCAVGGRSTTALSTFKELGFKKVVHLDDGLKGWERAGQPVRQ